MFCEQCGAELKSGARFCAHCGAAVPGAQAGAGVQQPAPQQSQQAQQLRQAAQDQQQPPTAGSQPQAAAQQVQPGGWQQPAAGPQPQTNAWQQPPAPEPIPVYHPQQAPATTQTPAEPPRKRRRAGLIAAVALVVLALAGVGVALYFFFGSSNAGTSAAGEDGAGAVEAQSTLEIYYTNSSPVVVSASTVVIAYTVDDEPMEHYQATITPADSETTPSWGSATLEVEGTGGFSLGSVGNIVPGTYDLSILDIDSGETYQCPGLVLVEVEEEADETDGEDADSGTTASDEESSAEDDDATDDSSSDTVEDVFDVIIIRPDPEDPEAAIAEAEAEYSYSMQSTTVTIEYSDDYYDETVTNDWIYPQFTCTEENEALEALNEVLAEDFEETLTAAKSWTIDSEDAQCLSYEVTVTYLEGHVASVRSELYCTYWGVHGFTTTTGAVYNLETGEKITPESVFGMSSAERRAAAIEALEAYLATDPSDLYDDDELAETIETIAETTNRYYIAEEGLVVVSGDYELGSFAWGTREVVVVAFEDESLVGTDVSGTYASGAVS